MAFRHFPEWRNGAFRYFPQYSATFRLSAYLLLNVNKNLYKLHITENTDH